MSKKCICSYVCRWRLTVLHWSTEVTSVEQERCSFGDGHHCIMSKKVHRDNFEDLPVGASDITSHVVGVYIYMVLLGSIPPWDTPDSCILMTDYVINL